MKRNISILLLLAILLYIIPIRTEATESKVYYFADGSFATVEVEVFHSRASNSISASKSYTYRDGKNVIQWKAVLTGSFTYNGSKATCTSSSIDVTIYDSEWYVIVKSAGKSENIARGSVTIGKKLLGVTVNQHPVSLTLTCDANGNLS